MCLSHSLHLSFSLCRKTNKKKRIKKGVASVSLKIILILIQNKQQRTAVRDAVLKNKNPITLLSEIEEIEKMGKQLLALDTRFLVLNNRN